MAELNTIVQFVAALYVTITFDNLMFKRFWTFDSYSVVRMVLDRFGFAISTPVRKKIMDAVEEIAIDNEQQSRRRGGYFLLICVYLLIAFVFEPQEANVSYNITILISLFFTLLVYIGGIFFWKRWLHVFLSLMLIVILTFAFLLLSRIYGVVNTFLSNIPLIYIKIEVLFVIILPIMIRLFLNWIKSIVYIKYLTNKLSDEFNRSRRTLNGLETKDRAKCDEAYSDIYAELYFSTELASDSINTAFVDILKKRLYGIIAGVSTWKLIRYACGKEYKTVVSIDESVQIDDRIFDKQIPRDHE